MNPKRYEQVAERIGQLIRQGTWPAGSRLPGIRRLAGQLKVSVATVQRALELACDWGLLESLPRSGHYVRLPNTARFEIASGSQPELRPQPVGSQELALNLVRASLHSDFIQLAAAVPAPEFLPLAAFNRSLRKALNQPDHSDHYCFPPGHAPLRKRIALRMLSAGVACDADRVLITNGCQEALTLALQAITRPGELVAVESPTFYGLLQIIAHLGLQALEIPTSATTGLDPQALRTALARWPVKAVVTLANFSNPLGFRTPDESKQALAAFCREHRIPLIENDIYGDLSFGPERPRALKAFDPDDWVIYCNSFSKTIAPGLRLGWLLGGRFQAQLEYLQYANSLSAPTLPQLAMADYLKGTAHDRYLRQVALRYRHHIELFRQAIACHFPGPLKLSAPQGGFVLWVELPAEIDTLPIYHAALRRRISFAPGRVFSVSGKFHNCLRLSCAMPWNQEVQQAIAELGRLLRRGHQG